MKAMMRIMGCILIVSLITISTMFDAYGKTSYESQKKERMKKSGWIGVIIQDVNEKIARKAGLDSEEGVYVNEVVENSPADSAGLKEGDIILEFDGKKLFDVDDLIKGVQRTIPGSKVGIVIVHEGEKKTIQLTVGKKRLKNRMFDIVPDIHVFVGNHILGLKLLTLNEQLGEYFDAPNNVGVLVEEVEKESVAEEAGFKAGDVITHVGGKTVNEVEKIRKELCKYDEDEKVEFEVLRKGVKKVIRVKMEEEPSIWQNFFFHNPHIRMFRSCPFDDAEMHLRMKELQPNLDCL